jgi:hypothetical protein
VQGGGRRRQQQERTACLQRRGHSGLHWEPGEVGLSAMSQTQTANPPALTHKRGCQLRIIQNPSRLSPTSFLSLSPHHTIDYIIIIIVIIVIIVLESGNGLRPQHTRIRTQERHDLRILPDPICKMLDPMQDTARPREHCGGCGSLLSHASATQGANFSGSLSPFLSPSLPPSLPLLPYHPPRTLNIQKNSLPGPSTFSHPPPSADAHVLGSRGHR